jgi:hypothetical protein
MKIQAIWNRWNSQKPEQVLGQILELEVRNKNKNNSKQQFAAEPRQYSHSWFRAALRAMAKFLIVSRPLICFEIEPLRRRDEGLVFL